MNLRKSMKDDFNCFTPIMQKDGKRMLKMSLLTEKVKKAGHRNLKASLFKSSMQSNVSNDFYSFELDEAS